MTTPLTLPLVRQQLTNGILNTSRQLIRYQRRLKGKGIIIDDQLSHLTPKQRGQYYSSLIGRRQGLALEAAAWLQQLGSGSESYKLRQVLLQRHLEQRLFFKLKNHKFDPLPQGLPHRLAANSPESLILGGGLELAFWRTSRRGSEMDPGIQPKDHGRQPIYVAPSGRVIVPCFLDEGLAVSLQTTLMPWAVQFAFNEINVVSGHRHLHGLFPRKRTDYVVPEPNRNIRQDGWQDLSPPSPHRGYYPVRQFAPLTPHNFPAILGVFRFIRYGLPPEPLVSRHQGTLQNLIDELHDGASTAQQAATLYLSSDHNAFSEKSTLWGILNKKKPSSLQRNIDQKLDKLIHRPDSLINLLQSKDPRNIPTLAGAGLVWQPNAVDPLSTGGQTADWRIRTSLTVFVVDPQTFQDWTGVEVKKD